MPVVFHRLGHGGRGLACAHNDRATLGRMGEEGREALVRHRACHGGVEHAAQEGYRVGRHCSESSALTQETKRVNPEGHEGSRRRPDRHAQEEGQRYPAERVPLLRILTSCSFVSFVVEEGYWAT